MSTPSEVLSRAADLIRDTAAKTTKPRKQHFGWGYLDADEVGDASHGTHVLSSGWGGSDVVAERVDWGDAEWITLLSPVVAPAVEAILREAADSAGRHVPVWQNSSTDGRDEPKRTDAEVAELVEHHYGPVLALARAILGKEASDVG